MSRLENIAINLSLNQIRRTTVWRPRVNKFKTNIHHFIIVHLYNARQTDGANNEREQMKWKQCKEMGRKQKTKQKQRRTKYAENYMKRPISHVLK